MLSVVRACAIVGLEGCIIEVQTDFNPRAQIPSFTIVGLPDSAVKESRERVRAAIKNSGLTFANKTYIVNLSPADLPKHGPAYDLPIAVGVLAATDQTPLESLERSLFMGELSLDGSVRHVKGIMPMVYSAYQEGFERVYVPMEDAPEAALVQGIEVIPVKSLGELVEHLGRLGVPLPRCARGDAESAQRLESRQALHFSPAEPLAHYAQAAVDRRAVRDALVHQGLLAIEPRHKRATPPPAAQQPAQLDEQESNTLQATGTPGAGRIPGDSTVNAPVVGGETAPEAKVERPGNQSIEEAHSSTNKSSASGQH